METQLIEEDKFKIPGYKVYRKDRLNRAGGVLLIKNCDKHFELLLPTTVNLGVVLINDLAQNSDIRIISAYKKLNICLIEDELKFTNCFIYDT
jgi:hypothetical protein